MSNFILFIFELGVEELLRRWNELIFLHRWGFRRNLNDEALISTNTQISTSIKTRKDIFRIPFIPANLFHNSILIIRITHSPGRYIGVAMGSPRNSAEDGKTKKEAENEKN